MISDRKVRIAIVGGGASGLMIATLLDQTDDVLLIERGERLGRKLSATGNGQGNVTNVNLAAENYFSSESQTFARLKKTFAAFSNNDVVSTLEGLGGLFFADERGRVYPTGRQASAVTDLFRGELARREVKTLTGERVVSIEKVKGGFLLKTAEEKPSEEKRTGSVFAENVVLCTGGKAAKNFGTDGNGYALAEAFGHSVTKLYPSLVQLKTDAQKTKTLKGIRAADVAVQAKVNGNTLAEVKGDIIFTEYGVSGDAAFRLSAYVTDRLSRENKVELSIDFLPEVAEDKLTEVLKRKIEAAKKHGEDEREILCGIVNNQIGRAIYKCVNASDAAALARAVKGFVLTVVGSLGFDYAQVTKGGIPLSETDENLQSRIVDGLYFAGEILDVDGACGGFNLQWAFSSAFTVARALNKKERRV